MHHPQFLPGQAAPPERAMMDLPAEELLIVGALRAWFAPHVAPHVAPLGAPGMAHPDWRELFRRAALPAAAAGAFDALMGVIGGHAMRLLEVRRCACPRLGPDEAAMLRLFAALQARDMPAALGVLTDWLPFDVVELGLAPALRCAALLADRGMRLAAQPMPAPGARGAAVRLQ